MCIFFIAYNQSKNIMAYVDFEFICDNIKTKNFFH